MIGLLVLLLSTGLAGLAAGFVLGSIDRYHSGFEAGRAVALQATNMAIDKLVENMAFDSVTSTEVTV